MDLALVGTGNMGQAVATVADERAHRIVARFDSDHPLHDADLDDLHGAHVAIDFSLPDVALDHIRCYCTWRQPAVIGTTGWYDRFDEVRALVEEHEATLLYAPNFSIGVAVLARLLAQLGPILDDFPEFDVGVHETHHTGKADSPSGTALMLANILRESLERKTHLATETQHSRIEEGSLHVTSSRVGGVFGEHTVLVDSPYDRITLEHSAKNRVGFAFGAVKAAEWLHGRPSGLYTLGDVLF